MRQSTVNLNEVRSRIACLAVTLLALAFAPGAHAQWSAAPGETVRNVFGPQKNQGAASCRGACGMNCPSSCEEEIGFECTGGDRLRRVRSLSCGTHQACRDHDDCLDRCTQENAEGYDCQTECHAEVMELFPVEQAASWAIGGGPFDGEPIVFEYTQVGPGDPEAFYRCPEGAQRLCSADRGTCQADKRKVDPVFTQYEGKGTASFRVSNFRSGRVCLQGEQPDSVCEGMTDIRVTGNDQCMQEGGSRRCTWFGFEFDYRNAIPGEPLYCQSSGTKGDFLGNIVSGALKSANADPDSELGDLLGALQKELNSGKSLDKVFAGISITTADGQTLGGPPPPPSFPSPGVPDEVAVTSSSGHLLVPIFELAGSEPVNSTVEHYIRCMQQSKPVIETTFRLHFVRN